MIYTFASRRQFSFIITVGFRNLLVAFGERNQAGVSSFLTSDDRVARVLRRHPLFKRGVIEETTIVEEGHNADDMGTAAKPAEKTAGTVAKKEPKPEQAPETTPAADATGVVEEPDENGEGMQEPEEQTEAKEREYDNYTVARESICKEFNVNKATVRNPTALARVALEHGIIIKYKEL